MHGDSHRQRLGLSAGHCVSDNAPLQLHAADCGTPTVTVTHAFVHPTLDVVLLQLDETGSAATSTIQLVPMPGSTLQAGATVLLAGRGLDEVGELGKLRFVTERVTSVEESFIITDGAGVSGACNGDSGGPLLTRDASGELQLAGVLSGGRASCTGVDEYVRADAIADWATALIDATHDARCSARR